MTLKQKSLTISLVTTVVFIFAIIGIIYNILIVKFQEIENQRAERNNQRVTAVIADRIDQINSKLSDWTVWDDTYEFLNDKNKDYIKSNLSNESFAMLNIDEALFISKDGSLVTGFMVANSDRKETSFPNDIYSHFATGSSLLKINKELGYNGGFLKVDDGVLAFAVRDVFKSDGTGEPAGSLVFARYFDKNLLDSIKKITLLNLGMYTWGDPKMPTDYQKAKDALLANNKKEIVSPLDDKTISGYIAINDFFGKPQIILRSDTERDIILQGKASVRELAWILGLIGTITVLANYWLLAGGVIRRITQISNDVENIGKSETTINRLTLSKNLDEVDKLRKEINQTLDSLQITETQLTDKENFIESIMENLTIGIAVNRISTGKTVFMNKAFENIYGWNKDVLISVDAFFEKVYPNQAELRQKVEEDIKSGDQSRMHWENLEVTKENGQKSFVNAKNIPLFDQDLMVSTVDDVTDQKIDIDQQRKNLEELQRLNDVMVDREVKMVMLKKELAKLGGQKL